MLKQQQLQQQQANQQQEAQEEEQNEEEQPSMQQQPAQQQATQQQEEYIPEFQMYQQNFNELMIYKVTSLVEGQTPKTMFPWIQNLQAFKYWREVIDTVEEIESLDENSSIIYEKDKDLGVLAPRDYVFIRQCLCTAQHAQIFDSSINHHLYPAQKNPQRGEILFRLYDMKLDQGGVKFEFIEAIDPCGTIPYDLYSQMAPFVIKKLCAKLLSYAASV